MRLRHLLGQCRFQAVPLSLRELPVRGGCDEQYADDTVAGPQRHGLGERARKELSGVRGYLSWPRGF
mgnify:CR=1 FL=1